MSWLWRWRWMSRLWLQRLRLRRLRRRLWFRRLLLIVGYLPLLLIRGAPCWASTSEGFFGRAREATRPILRTIGIVALARPNSLTTADLLPTPAGPVMGIAVVGRTTTAQKASASAANCVKEVEASPEGQIVYARLANDDTDTAAKLSDQKPLTKNEQDALVCRTRFFQIAGRYTLKLLARLRRGAGAGPGSSWFNALNMAMRAIISMPPASAAEIRNFMATCQCSRSAGDSARM
jgi:hypothetical protein